MFSEGDLDLINEFLINRNLNLDLFNKRELIMVLERPLCLLYENMINEYGMIDEQVLLSLNIINAGGINQLGFPYYDFKEIEDSGLSKKKKMEKVYKQLRYEYQEITKIFPLLKKG